MVTREAIETRLAELKAQYDQLMANLNACGGAIQDCEHWLRLSIEQAEKKAE